MWLDYCPWLHLFRHKVSQACRPHPTDVVVHYNMLWFFIAFGFIPCQICCNFMHLFPYIFVGFYVYEFNQELVKIFSTSGTRDWLASSSRLQHPRVTCEEHMRKFESMLLLGCLSLFCWNNYASFFFLYIYISFPQILT